jgi:hypothetical protein
MTMRKIAVALFPELVYGKCDHGEGMGHPAGGAMIFLHISP